MLLLSWQPTWRLQTWRRIDRLRVLLRMLLRLLRLLGLRLLLSRLLSLLSLLSLSLLLLSLRLLHLHLPLLHHLLLLLHHVLLLCLLLLLLLLRGDPRRLTSCGRRRRNRGVLERGRNRRDQRGGRIAGGGVHVHVYIRVWRVRVLLVIRVVGVRWRRRWLWHAGHGHSHTHVRSGGLVLRGRIGRRCWSWHTSETGLLWWWLHDVVLLLITVINRGCIVGRWWYRSGGLVDATALWLFVGVVIRVRVIERRETGCWLGWRRWCRCC